MKLSDIRLEVDLKKINGVIRPLHGVNMGPLMMNGWIDFSKTYKELSFPLTRLHDCVYAVPEVVDVHCIFPLFHADHHDPRNYRFKMTDDYIQAILDTGSQIVYRLGESIEHHTRGKYHVHPPADFNKWAEICVNIIRHYNEGWANGFRHNIRYWEIWNEPWGQPSCWTGSNEDYFRLYEIAAKAIKAFDPSLKVGGPTAFSGKPDSFARQFLAHCKKTKAPLDFYSWHLYPRDPLDIVRECTEARCTLDKAGFRKTESHLNEWSLLPSEGWKFNSREKDADCIERACEEIGGVTGAAFIAATLIYLQDCPLDVANYYWVRDGLWGILSQWGRKQKNYYAFKAFRSMLDTARRVKTTPNDAAKGHAILAGLSGRKQAGIMLTNFRARETNFSVKVKGWPWKGSAVCRRYLLDQGHDLTLVEEHKIDGKSPVVNFCMPAPAFCYMSMTPG